MGSLLLLKETRVPRQNLQRLVNSNWTTVFSHVTKVTLIMWIRNPTLVTMVKDTCTTTVPPTPPNNVSVYHIDKAGFRGRPGGYDPSVPYQVGSAGATFSETKFRLLGFFLLDWMFCKAQQNAKSMSRLLTVNWLLCSFQMSDALVLNFQLHFENEKKH